MVNILTFESKAPNGEITREAHIDAEQKVVTTHPDGSTEERPYITSDNPINAFAGDTEKRAIKAIES